MSEQRKRSQPVGVVKWVRSPEYWAGVALAGVLGIAGADGMLALAVLVGLGVTLMGVLGLVARWAWSEWQARGGQAGRSSQPAGKEETTGERRTQGQPVRIAKGVRSPQFWAGVVSAYELALLVGGGVFALLVLTGLVVTMTSVPVLAVRWVWRDYQAASGPNLRGAAR